ncbi:hypothetical protein BJ508DRAFT_33324 [Ascobolus immersus RN42]|uniref:Uncharacterized protein n=1 Tax=Ascobolus immersus RN42 TaxID=1160509 RepID=A0A3N4HN18_ASCIM|nr:hypothetical protein BJ508DRAFT_33324 [Ascobolus immersus RN42]
MNSSHRTSTNGDRFALVQRMQNGSLSLSPPTSLAFARTWYVCLVEHFPISRRQVSNTTSSTHREDPPGTFITVIDETKTLPFKRESERRHRRSISAPRATSTHQR